MTIARPRTSGPRQRPPAPRRGRLGNTTGRGRLLASAPTSWYDLRDIIATTAQSLANRAGTGSALFGPTSGVEANDPIRLPHSGTHYVYLPGTASNNLSVVKGAWAGTLHVTATLTDNTTATFTTTADPVLIGDTLLTAGRYRRFDVRDTDGNGTLRVTIEPSVETIGHTSWTSTTGQTVTVNRATSGITTAVVTRPVALLDGADDYIQLPAGDTPTFDATTGAYTVLLINRIHNAAGGGQQTRVWSSESGALNGGLIYLDQANFQYIARIGGAVTSVVTTAVVFTQSTQLHAVAAVFDAGSVKAYTTTTGLTAGVSYAGVGAITHATPAWGSRAYTPSTSDFETYAAVTWPRALTATELGEYATYLLGNYA